MSASVDTIRILVLGAGRKQKPSDYGIHLGGKALTEDQIDLVTLDCNPDVGPKLVCMLGRDAIDLPDNSVDFCVAMHVIEHIGPAGDAGAWFQMWNEIYRVLKPNAFVQFECPYHSSVWAWADPTHVRAISEFTFLYLNQDAYRSPGSAIPAFHPQCDFTLADWNLKADCNPEVVAKEGNRSHCEGKLVARKPLKPWWED